VSIDANPLLCNGFCHARHGKQIWRKVSASVMPSHFAIAQPSVTSRTRFPPTANRRPNSPRRPAPRMHVGWLPGPARTIVAIGSCPVYPIEIDL
jgi:hypothetical protein